MGDCAHGMPSPASCVECMEEGNLPPAPRPPDPTAVAHFVARYDGDCRSCGFPIDVGQRIASLSDGSYVHDHCAPVGVADLFGSR